MHSYIHTYVHTYIHAYIHTSMHTYIHQYIHTYVCMNTHICIHTYKQGGKMANGAKSQMPPLDKKDHIADFKVYLKPKLYTLNPRL